MLAHRHGLGQSSSFRVEPIGNFQQESLLQDHALAKPAREPIGIADQFGTLRTEGGGHGDDPRARLDALLAAGAVVVGISTDGLRSHANFVAKQGLNFPLISDPDRVVHELFSAWVEKKNYGKTTMGTERCTFLLDCEGRVARVWRKVRVKGHADAVLEAAREI